MHTKEPWFWSGTSLMGSAGLQSSRHILWCDENVHISHPSDEDAARIVACVNACAGVSNEALALLPEIIEQGRELIAIDAALAKLGDG